MNTGTRITVPEVESYVQREQLEEAKQELANEENKLKALTEDEQAKEKHLQQLTDELKSAPPKPYHNCRFVT